MSVNKTYIWLLIFLLIACKHKKEVIETNNQVLAGVVSSNMAYSDFEPDIIVDSLPDTIRKGGTTYSRHVDLDYDGVIDLYLISYTIFSSSFEFALQIGIRPSVEPKNAISIMAADSVYYGFNSPQLNSYYCSGRVKKLKHKDVIGSQTGVWSPTDTLFKGYPLSIGNFYLAFRDASNNDVYQGDANNWRDVNNRYMAFRREIGKDTLYGWVRMSVVGYTKIILHDWAIQKP